MLKSVHDKCANIICNKYKTSLIDVKMDDIDSKESKNDDDICDIIEDVIKHFNKNNIDFDKVNSIICEKIKICFDE